VFEDIQPKLISVDAFAHASTDSDRLGFLACCGALAPSTHNSQPWRVSLGEGVLDISPDHTRRLPLADPNGRQLCLSIGAFLANVEYGAAELGFKTESRIEGSSVDSVRAVVQLDGRGREPKRQALDILKARRNNRHPFMGEAPDIAVGDAADGVPKARFVTSVGLKEHIADLVARSLKVFLSSGEFRRELSAWVTSNSSIRQDGMPGYTHRVPSLLSPFFPSLVRYLNLAPVFSRRDRRLIQGSPTVGVVTVSRDAPVEWVEAGRLYENLALRLTAEGYSTAMHSAVIESPQDRAELAAALETKDSPVALFRVGRPAASTPPSPRRPLGNFLGMEGRRSR